MNEDYYECKGMAQEMLFCTHLVLEKYERGQTIISPNELRNHHYTNDSQVEGMLKTNIKHGKDLHCEKYKLKLGCFNIHLTLSVEE